MKAQLIKILKGAIIAGLGALLTYLTESLANVDFGNWTPTVVAIFSVLVNIIRKVLAAWGAKVAVGSLAVLALALPAHAQNLATPFSHGPTLPVYTINWDKAGTMYSDFLAAGAGYSFNFNRMPNESGTVRMLTIAMPIFFNVTGNGEAPATTRFYAGLTIGTFNNLLSFGPALKLMEAQEGAQPAGVFDSGLKKENVALLLSFSLNFGSGTPAGVVRRTGAMVVAPDKIGPPPAYVKLW